MSEIRYIHGAKYRFPWLRPHKNLIHSDSFIRDERHVSQKDWEEAYWDSRHCIKYRHTHQEIYRQPYNINSLIRVLALYIILLAAMFSVMVFAIIKDSRLDFSNIVIPYIIVTALATWLIYSLYRHKVDYFWRLYSRRLHIYEKIWPGIKKMAEKDQRAGVTETPPPLARRDRT